MPNMTLIRQWQFEQMQRATKIYSHILSSASQETITTYRDGGTGWTMLEVICHLCDFEDVFRERVCVTLEQDSPDLPFPNPDQTAAAGNYMEQDLAATLAEWTRKREDFLMLLGGIPDQQWERIGNHPVRGLLTLNEQLMLVVSHDQNHLEQMTRILAEKQS